MASAGVVGGVPGGIPGGQMGGVIGGIISSTPVAVPKVATPQRVRVSAGVTTGLLVRKVSPTILRWRGRLAFKGPWCCMPSSVRMVHRKPYLGQRASNAGSGGDRGSEAVAVQALSAERRTSRSGYGSTGELHPGRRLKPRDVDVAVLR